MEEIRNNLDWKVEEIAVSGKQTSFSSFRLELNRGF
jgi:hypothetical protein